MAIGQESFESIMEELEARDHARNTKLNAAMRDALYSLKFSEASHRESLMSILAAKEDLAVWEEQRELDGITSQKVHDFLEVADTEMKVMKRNMKLGEREMRRVKKELKEVKDIAEGKRKVEEELKDAEEGKRQVQAELKGAGKDMRRIKKELKDEGNAKGKVQMQLTKVEAELRKLEEIILLMETLTDSEEEYKTLAMKLTKEKIVMKRQLRDSEEARERVEIELREVMMLMKRQFRDLEETKKAIEEELSYHLDMRIKNLEQYNFSCDALQIEKNNAFMALAIFGKANVLTLNRAKNMKVAALEERKRADREIAELNAERAFKDFQINALTNMNKELVAFIEMDTDRSQASQEKRVECVFAEFMEFRKQNEQKASKEIPVEIARTGCMEVEVEEHKAIKTMPAGRSLGKKRTYPLDDHQATKEKLEEKTYVRKRRASKPSAST